MGLSLCHNSDERHKKIKMTESEKRTKSCSSQICKKRKFQNITAKRSIELIFKWL